MNEISTLRELRPVPSQAELEAMRMAARERFAAGTAPKPRRPQWRYPQWRRPVLAGGLTVAAAAAGTAAALVLTGGPGTLPGPRATTGNARTVVTTAWTVREDSSGTVTITLQQYANPARLQQTLQADGVTAIVRPIPYVRQTSSNGKPVVFPTCNYITTNDREPLAVQRSVLTIGREALPALFIIHPDAMPPGSALFLAFMANPPRAAGNVALKPVVLSSDAVPACMPVATKPVQGTTAPTSAPKQGRSVPSTLPRPA